MSIENIGSMNSILKNYQASDWLKNSELELKTQKLDTSIIDSPEKAQSFSDFLMNSVKDVNDLQMKANDSIQKLATGDKTNLHETMLAVEKADIAFKAMNQIRHKVIDAYKEVMRMQV